MKTNKSFLPIIDTMDLYRMPWSFSDNPFSWMEPTRNCNLACEYCYQEHDRNSNKTLEVFESELRSILAVRRCDTINIAGGEPLLHPQIHQIVTLVRSYGLKPHLITNGVTLTPELLRSLKAAGAAGITFHVDALQRRPGYRDADEIKLNELRQHYADMVHDAGGLVCGFTATIVPSMVHQSGSIVAWTLRNSDRVATHMLIPVRLARAEAGLEYYAGNLRINPAESVYVKEMDYRPLSAAEIYAEILRVVPALQFSSFLGGTVLPGAPKWLFANPVSSVSKVYGYLGPRGMELLQHGMHFIAGRFLGLLPPFVYRHGGMLFLLGLVDRGMRRGWFTYLRDMLRNPLKAFKQLNFQTIIVMQPQDMLENGDQDQCDGCPNKTLINGRLVSECRGDDFLRYGRMIQAVRVKGSLVS